MKIRIRYPDNLAGERHSNPHFDQRMKFGGCVNLHPAYTRPVDALGAVRLKCNDIRLAIKAHRKELRDKGK